MINVRIVYIYQGERQICAEYFYLCRNRQVFVNLPATLPVDL